MQPNTFTHRQADPPQTRPGGFSFFKKLGALALVLVGLGASQQAWGQDFYDDAITLTQQPTGQSSQDAPYAGQATDSPYDSYTPLGNSSANPQVATPGAGTYDLNGNSVLTLKLPSLIVSAPGRNRSYPSAYLNYRVYLASTPTAQIPSYSQIQLNAAGNDANGDNVYNNTGASVNLLNGLTSGGTYTIDVQFGVNVKAGSNVSSVTDPSNNGYSVSFYVTPPPTTPPGGTTTWQGVARGTSPGGSPAPTAADRNWFNIANWTNGVPTRFSNAIIPEKSNSIIVYPLLNNPTAAYEVNNLTLQGAQGASAANITIGAATLSIYGNFSQESDPGLVANTTGNSGVTDATQNSTVILAGADQTITGNIIVSDLIVAGSGTKSVLTPITSTNIVAFEPSSVTNGVILQSALQRTTNSAPETVFSTNGRAYVQLLSTSQISIAAGQAETTVSYIKGVARADRQLSNGQPNTFGNIGLDITSNHDVNNLVMYRVVGAALTGPISSTAVPIKRSYQLTGDDNSNTAGFANSAIDVVFHYLDSGPNTSANELNGIDENNLTMFRTVNNGAPYQTLGGTVNTAANTVTRYAVPSLQDYKITLGDKTNPLPVTLATFAAIRSGNNALVTWTTATEENNQGFNVQVSADGVKFRTLGFVESKVTNSVQAQNYSYTDVEAGKTGTRYYRLEQVDVNGTKSYSPVKAVSFNGAAATSLSLSASPNPFADQLALSFDGPSVSDGTVHVKIMDMTGRTVRDQSLTMSGASIALGNLSELRSGLYIAKVTLADGTTKTVRIQRQ